MAKKPKKSSTWTIQRIFPYILIITGLIALIASFVLTLEHIALYKDPNHQLSCSLNPVFSCGPVMKSDQAVVFGFPNPIIGLVVFGAQIMLGVVMLAGARMKKWLWQLFGVNILANLAFTFWLMSQSFFDLKALCIYCMATWVAVFVSSWYYLQYMLAEGHMKLGNKKLQQFVRQHHLDIIVGWFVLIALLILKEFWYYYSRYFY